MLFSILSLQTLETIKREALETLTSEGLTDEASAVAETLIHAVDAECDRRIAWVTEVMGMVR